MKFDLLINLISLTNANSFLLSIAGHEIFSANKYENANYCWHFHIYEQRNLAFSYLSAEKISCSAELSMKKKCKNSFLLNIAEHENFSASKYENMKVLFIVL